MEVDMMGVEVVRDIGRFSCPGLECVKLVLWLRHVTVEEGERAQMLDPIPSIGIDRVKALVKFHLHQHLVLRSCI
jgi:hypothetical protein